MLSALRQRNFALLSFGGLVSDIGDWLLFVSLPYYVYTLTGSAAATGAMFVAQMVPYVLLGPVAGVFVDRWDRRRIMIAADLARGVLLLPLLALHSAGLVWIAYPVAFLQAGISQFFMPAKSALVPALVGEQELVPANSLNSFIDNISRLLGPTLGGAMFGLFGLAPVVWLDSGSFFVSALMIVLISVPRLIPEEAGTEVAHMVASAAEKVWREWVDGLRIIRGSRLVSAVFLAGALVSVTEGFLAVLFVVFVKGSLHGTALQYGWLLSAQAVGGLLGSFAVGHVGRRIPPIRLLAASCFADGILILGIFNFRSLPLALVLFALAGPAIAGFSVSTNTLLQTHVDDAFRGRVFASAGSTFALSMIGGMIIAATVGSRVGPVPVLDAGGALWLVAAGIALANGRREPAESSQTAQQSARVS